MLSGDQEADWLLGVDGGGTKTHFLLCRRNGSEQHVHVGAGTYYLEVGLQGVADVLAAGLALLYERAGITSHDIAHAFFGMPAYGEDPAGDASLRRIVTELLGHGRLRCDNDMVCAWAGSLGGADGINVVAGTG